MRSVQRPPGPIHRWNACSHLPGASCAKDVVPVRDTCQLLPDRTPVLLPRLLPIIKDREVSPYEIGTELAKECLTVAPKVLVVQRDEIVTRLLLALPCCQKEPDNNAWEVIISIRPS